MPKIAIENLFGKVLEVTENNRSLLQHFHDHRVDWMQDCGGKGKCTSCKVIVLEGIEHFSPLTPAEQKFVQMKALKKGERLSCQSRISGDVVIKVPAPCKLPHILYSDRG